VVTKRPQKITFGEICESGVRGVLVYCSEYKCSRHTAISGDQWPLMFGYPILSRVSSAPLTRFSLGQAGLAHPRLSDPAQTTSCAWVTNTPQ
jgi:hypothetical protein